MPSWICCSGPEHHSCDVRIYEAASNLSAGKAIGPLCKKCGAELEYKVKQPCANDGSTATYTVKRAAGLNPELLSDRGGYDPFLLLLRDDETGKELFLPTFWAPNESKLTPGGRYPPIMSLDEWRELFRKLARYETDYGAHGQNSVVQ
jgi:hypothetical protein